MLSSRSASAIESRLRIVAGEGRLQLGGDAALQLLGARRPDLLQEREQQPAAHAPGHAEVARELGRAGVEAAVEIDLLVRGRAVAAVFLGVAVERRFHARRGSGRPACRRRWRRRRASRRWRRAPRSGRCRKLGALASQTSVAPIARSSAACSGLRTMLTSFTPSAMQMRLSIWPRLEAAAVCTSALWPSRRIVSTMPSAVSGLTKQEAPSAGVAPVGQRQALLGRERPVLRVHRAAEHGDGLAEQRLRRRRGARGDDHAGAFVADRHRGVEPRRPSPSSPPSGIGAVTTGRSRVPEATALRHVGGAEQQAEVGRIDRRRLEPHQHLVRPGLGNRHLGQRELRARRCFLTSERSCRAVRASVELSCASLQGWGGECSAAERIRARMLECRRPARTLTGLRRRSMGTAANPAGGCHGFGVAAARPARRWRPPRPARRRSDGRRLAGPASTRRSTGRRATYGQDFEEGRSGACTTGARCRRLPPGHPHRGFETVTMRDARA